MRRSVRIIFLAVSLFSFSQLFANQGTLNQLDQAGLKHGYWVLYGKDRPDSGFAPDSKIEEGTYVHGRKEGEWIKYHLDGQTVKLKGVYVHNRPCGYYTKYHSNGKLKEKGMFVHKQFQGERSLYDEEGRLTIVENYCDALDSVSYYNANGCKDSTIILEPIQNTLLVHFFSDSKCDLKLASIRRKLPENPISCYIPKKNLMINNQDPIIIAQQPKKLKDKLKVENPILKNGAKFNPDGFNKVYNKSDEIWIDGEFRESCLFNGKVYIYDQDGILLKVKIYKEGSYFEDGQL